MRRQRSVNVIMYIPKTEEGRLELARRVSDVHANAVNRRLKDLVCPTSQKLALLDAVIQTAREKSQAAARAQTLTEQYPQKEWEQDEIGR